jgi:deoxyribodipyrimidine photo-lyase
MQFKCGLFIFRRDLRLDDNTGLLAALEQCESVIPAFIFDPRQIGNKNQYRSANAIRFMIESLQDLDNQLRKKKARLYCWYGVAEEVVEKLLKSGTIDAIFCNQDYTPFGLKRDEAIEHACIRHDVSLFSYHDLLLINNPDSIKTGNGTQYTKFTPFFTKARKFPVKKPRSCRSKNFYTKKFLDAKTLPVILKKLPLSETNNKLLISGGRAAAKQKLRTIGLFKDYARTHDFPWVETTMLSPHAKFGTVSIREIFYAINNSLGDGHPLIRQLYWRDFFTYVAYYSPFVFGQPYQEKYKKIPWENNEKQFQAWWQGKTGFPIIDAGMRQLNKTGFIHNRVRMLVASFLAKDLLIDWRWGEEYFARNLVDYDPAVNNGNWQWCASTGSDAQPYFRIFNPWLQQKKFDRECRYIKTWVPELRNVPPKIIHAWFDVASPKIKNYPRPIVDHATTSVRAKRVFKSVS